MRRFLLLLTVVCCALSASAISFEVGDISYSEYRSGKSVVVNGLSAAGKNASNIFIPGWVNYNGITYNVEIIDVTAFYEEYSIKSVSIEYGVKQIMYAAFKSCANLATVSIPSSVTSIGKEAFANTNINDIYFKCLDMPTIADDAFAGAGMAGWRVWSPTQPASNKAKAVTALANVNPTYEVDANQCCDVKSDGLCYITTKASTTTSDGELTLVGPVNYSGNLTANWISLSRSDAGVTGHRYSPVAIADEAFNKSSTITGVTIPSHYKTIGNNAFSKCSKITYATIGAKTIGKYAFYACDMLQTVTLNEGVTEIGLNAFDYLTALTTMSIPSTLETNNSDFYHNIKMQKYTGNTDRSKTFFVSDNGLLYKKVDGRISLLHCPPYASITSVPDYTNTILSLAFKSFQGTTMVLPFGVRAIYQEAFAESPNLKYVNIPSSVSYLQPQHLFASCPNLIHLHINCATPPSMISFSTMFGLSHNSSLLVSVPGQFLDDYKNATGWKDYAGRITYGAVDLHTYEAGQHCYYRLDIFNKLAYVAYASDTYRGWSTESDVTGNTVVPEKVYYKGDYYTVKGIDDYGLMWAKNLYLTLPKTITYIGRGAFYRASFGSDLDLFHCSNLTSIEPDAFHMSNRRNIILPPSSIDVGNNAWEVDADRWNGYYIYVPVDKVSFYYNAANKFTDNKGNRFDNFVTGYLLPTEKGKAAAFANPWDFSCNAPNNDNLKYLTLYKVTGIDASQAKVSTEAFSSANISTAMGGGNGFLYRLDGTDYKYIKLLNRSSVNTYNNNRLRSYRALSGNTETTQPNSCYLTFNSSSQKFETAMITGASSSTSWPFSGNTAYIQGDTRLNIASGYAVDFLSALTGDLNGDGQVNAADVSELYAAILRGDTNSRYDLNGDTQVNAADVSALYSIILAQ